MNDVYIIQTEEEYDAVQTRLNILWDNIKEITKPPYPNIDEIIKLEDACHEWDERKERFKFLDD